MRDEGVPVYIVLSYTGTKVSKLIRRIASMKYAHVSISLNDNLDEMYSFARKGVYNLFNAGFIKENIRTGMFKRMCETELAVFELPVSAEQYHEIVMLLEEFWQKRDTLSYNFVGLPLMAFGGIKTKLSKRFFCSQFIAHILERCGVRLFEKDSSIVSPQDFYEALAVKGELLYEGRMLYYPKYHTIQDRENIVMAGRKSEPAAPHIARFEEGALYARPKNP